MKGRCARTSRHQITGETSGKKTTNTSDDLLYVRGGFSYDLDHYYLEHFSINRLEGGAMRETYDLPAIGGKIWN